ncbi:MAG TPA: helix-turn-helix domain-containing protein [Planctomycetaceae bacterium]|nr:helix-turn-helix domain-containing protein [Planctomycetaceae bacterium]
MEVFRQLEKRRRELRMPRATLAKRSGVSLATVNRILSGQHKGATFENVLAIAEALGMEITTVRHGTSSEIREQQATRKARNLVRLVQGTSALEGQGLDQEELDEMIEQTARELSLTNRKLWAE